jgi:simple sugar transport system permease protein
MIRFEPRTRASPLLRAGATAGAVAAALALAAIPLVAAGAPLVRAFGLMAQGAAGSPFALTETLTRSTPLIFTGLAAAVAFRARLYNIGGEGQLYLGALAAVAVGAGAIEAPPYVLIPLVLLAGALAGALLMLVPTLLRTRLGVDEVVTTLLLNFVVILFVQMMLEGPLKDPMGGGWPQSAPILPEGTLPVLVERTRLHAGFPIALAASVLVYVLIARTALGLKIRAVGENPAAARFTGISVTGVMMVVGLLSGALAGLAGASEVAGLKGYLTSDMSRGFGYAGIVVAMVAGLAPLAVIPAAIFIAGVFVGADTMSRTIGVSNYIADLIVALSLLCVLVSGLFVRFRIRLG